MFKLLKKSIQKLIGSYGFAFAQGSVNKICFYIFHQPKFPKELSESKEK